MPKKQVLAKMVKVYYLIDKNNVNYPLSKEDYEIALSLFDGGVDNENKVLKFKLGEDLICIRVSSISSLVTGDRPDPLKPIE